MPTLYTMPGTCSLSPNIAVAWLGAPLEIQNIPYGDQKKDYYLAINPKGQVPALRFDDGEVLTEASAVLAWLGATYGDESYARDTQLGRKEAEALSYMTSEVHAAYGGHFNTQKFAETDAGKEEVKRRPTRSSPITTGEWTAFSARTGANGISVSAPSQIRSSMC